MGIVSLKFGIVVSVTSFQSQLVVAHGSAQQGQQPIYRSGHLKEKEITAWVEEARSASGPVESGMRILLCPKATSTGKALSGKLPFSRETYLALSQAWRIPPLFLRAIAQKLSIVTKQAVPRFSPPPASPLVSSPSSPGPKTSFSEIHTHYPERAKSAVSDSASSLLIRGDVDWTWDYTLHLTHDPVNNMTLALIVGLTATEIDLVLSYVSAMVSPSSPCKSLPTNPLLLPVILLDLACDETSALIKLRLKILSRIQQRTGMDRFNSLKTVPIAGERKIGEGEVQEELDLDVIMLRLTCLSDWVAAQKGFIGIQTRVVGVVADWMAHLQDGEKQRIHGGGNLRDEEDVLEERLGFIKECLQAAEAKCEYLTSSIGAQVQTIYTLIAQKDSRLNHSAASASCQLASDSRRIAILTRRDSTDMRIIAAVTLIFLPGTFVATLFSTGLFDWGYGSPTPNATDDEGSENGGEDGGGIVSSYIWVYFMLTGALTCVVLGAWMLFSKYQERRMKKWFGVDVEEGGPVLEASVRRDSEKTLVERRGRLRGRWSFWQEWGKNETVNHAGGKVGDLKSV
ncbi:hypothetical protein BS50DRAFT_637191 [Corynespora cassiicola Philippines]|uniref:Cora-domain-containing protein n=1 Tax=Corynespora cassiicola Philippines TaxID=1448308 RepID=A0A2T2NEH3_CORCC|nr:hypothetical protein BS50DRAFT_637191 [Corynespora cassiicola Philippines]